MYNGDEVGCSPCQRIKTGERLNPNVAGEKMAPFLIYPHPSPRLSRLICQGAQPFDSGLPR